MPMGRVFAACASALLLLASPAMAANTTESDGVILVRGNKMYNSKTGQRFIIKGMTYEYVVDDEHYDKYSKVVIAKHLANVELNTLRLYDINPDLSYDKFMKDMAAQGVYVIVGGTPDNTAYFTKYREGTLKKASGPEDEVSCYSPILLEYGKKILKNFAKYDNTLAILIGNEVMQKDLTPAACVKQYTADLKTWMRVNSKKMRLIPIAYAAADSAYAGKINSGDEYHTLKLQGLLCGDKVVDGVTMRSIDLYLINEYRWCPGRTFAVYQTMQTMAQGLPIPIGFGEYGCKLDAPRDWAMVPYFYDEPSKTEGFSDLFSGGLAYSFGEAKLPPGSLFPMFSGGSMDPLGQPSNVPSEDFTNLKDMFAKHPVYSDVATWDNDTKCKWTPEISASISPSNKRASTSGWIIPDCSADVLKVIPSDTWVMKSRQGMDCAAGDECDVLVKEVLGTTQEDLCGKSTEPVTDAPGGLCKSSDECLNGGECVEADSVKQCKCAKCYTGTNCGFKDESTCPSTSSAPSVTPEPSSAASGITCMTAVVAVVASVTHSFAL